MDLFSTERSDSSKTLTVTQLLRRMKQLLEMQIGQVWIEGEVSNLRKQASGHWYFSLKDEGAQISCAMFGARKRTGAEFLEDGRKFRVLAEASVYEARGQLQVIVLQVKVAGIGELQAKFEQLKQTLAARGWFDAAHKQALPAFPRVIGLITSGSGAALQDMLQVLGRRAPWVQPVLMPVRVQGRGAEREIALAIEQMGAPERWNLPRCDVLIVGRGGGSLEDLWNFNEEIVARAIFDCPIPIISAVGHEIDFTIADFVADLRAPTPSAAAELAVPDGAECRARVDQLQRRAQRVMAGSYERAQARLDQLRRSLARRAGPRLLMEQMLRVDHLRQQLELLSRARLAHSQARLAQLSSRHLAQRPDQVLDRRERAFNDLRHRLQRSARDRLAVYQQTLHQQHAILRALGPISVFQRGFSITLDREGKLIRSAKQLASNTEMITQFADGRVTSHVTDVFLQHKP